MENRATNVITYVTTYYFPEREGWSGICASLDLAVQGENLVETDQLMQEAISVYLRYILDVPPREEQEQLMARHVPLRVWVGLELRMWWGMALSLMRLSKNRPQKLPVLRS